MVYLELSCGKTVVYIKVRKLPVGFYKKWHLCKSVSLFFFISTRTELHIHNISVYSEVLAKIHTLNP